MKLSAESTFLMKKQLKQAIGPIETGGAAVLSTLAFAVAFTCVACTIRATSNGAAMLGIGALIGTAVLSSALGVARVRARRPARTWLVCALALWAGILIGAAIGNNWWYMGAAKYLEYKEMASYVNINPSSDKAGSYMDAGALYFQDGTKVLTSKALAFRNGLTYCIAPIYLDSLVGDSSNSSAKTAAGFVVPKSGTIDFWAVGTDCCGTTGTPFTCKDAVSPLARSGLRVLDDNHRAMYQLAVQEWTATTGLPSKHPMFLEWVIDPLAVQDELHSMAGNAIPAYAFGYFLAALFVSYVLHIIFRHFKFM